MDKTLEHRTGRTPDQHADPAPILLGGQIMDLLDTLGEACYTVDEHWRITALNHTAEMLWNQARDELVGINPELRSAMRERQCVAFEYHLPALERWFDVRAYPGGKGLAIFLHDITKRKQVEIERERLLAELEESRRMFQGIAEASPDLHYIFDLESGCAVYVSARSEQLLGYTAAGLMDLGTQIVPTLVHPDDLSSIMEHLQALQTLADREIYTFEIRSLYPDGAYHWLHTSASVYARGDDGQVRQVIGVTRDITERKQAEAELRRAHDELEVKVVERTRELAAANAALQQENREHHRTEHARQQLFQQLVTAQEEERRRIARELHDSLGQYLSALRVGLEGMQAQDGCPPHIADGLQRLCQLALTLDTAVDRLAFELRPTALDDLGLDDALGTLVREWSATSHIPVDMHIRGFGQRRLPTTLETTVYRVVQETLTNILKHAQATSVSLVVEQRNGEVLTIIEDNGQGFDLLAVAQPRDAQQPLGLKGMRERVALVDGRIDIETSPGAGTAVYMHMPLPLDAGDRQTKERLGD